MATTSLKEQIIDVLDRLSPAQQAEVLAFTKRLLNPLPPGTPGEVLLARMNSFQFKPGTLEEMARVIEEDCERIDWDGWE